MFHGGDSDSTGIIAGACYGAMFGLEGVPANNYRHLEYRDRLEELGSQLFNKSNNNRVRLERIAGASLEETGTDRPADPTDKSLDQVSSRGEEGVKSVQTEDYSIAPESDTPVLPVTESKFVQTEDCSIKPPESDTPVLPVTESKFVQTEDCSIKPPESDTPVLPAAESKFVQTEDCSIKPPESDTPVLPAAESKFVQTEDCSIKPSASDTPVLPAAESKFVQTKDCFIASESDTPVPPVTEGKLVQTENSISGTESATQQQDAEYNLCAVNQAEASSTPIELDQPTANDREEITSTEQDIKNTQEYASKDLSETQGNIPEKPTHSNPIPLSEEQVPNIGADEEAQSNGDNVEVPMDTDP